MLTSLVALTTVVFGPTSIAQPTAGGLTLVKSASPRVGVKSGDTVTYTFAVTNTGQTPISQVAVDDAISRVPVRRHSPPARRKRSSLGSR
ncbi:hypothetical protein P9209_00260 [Prescottella defluvii]|nr:hypothetical protein P9209_00260 [Prescottella defluvii]